jgi:hypothetical protein
MSGVLAIGLKQQIPDEPFNAAYRSLGETIAAVFNALARSISHWRSTPP